MKLVLNALVCTGCRCCELACSGHNADQFSPDRARVRVTSSREKHSSYISVCIQCSDEPCVEACLVGAIKRDPADAVVKIDYETCTGCLDCLEACPYDGIMVDSATSQPIKCELCRGDPVCVQFCRPGALVFA